MEMHGIEPHEVRRIIDAPGIELIDVQENGSAGDQWTSYQYTIRKAGHVR
jgi:hypothetical protein